MADAIIPTMPSSHRPLRRVAVAAYPRIEKSMQLAESISAFLQQRGLDASPASIHDEDLRRAVQANAFDLLIALGGDGTMLRAGHLCAPYGLPILGINLGRIGFLTEIEPDQWQATMERLLQGEYWLEHRMMLHAALERGGQLIGEWEALNECVIGRGAMVRLIRLHTEVDGRLLATYAADGLIIATPTGSTAYALAAGGPILPPELRNILIVPVAPHLSIDRAVVLHEGSSVHVTIRTDHQASLSIDGQLPVDVLDQDCADVRVGEYSATFVRFQDPGYFYRNLTSRLVQNSAPGADA
jgi:NAD+ kinase